MLKQTVSTAMLLSCDLEKPIQGSNCVDCDDFEVAYLEAARAADEAGNHEQALVYRLLATLCSFHFIPEEKVEPFSNKMALSDGSRTLVGSDFDNEEVASIAEIVRKIENLALRSRLADFVWSRSKARVDFARLALDGYVGLVRGLISGTHKERFGDRDATGVAAEQFLRRAVLIARSLGWNKGENESLRETLRAVLRLASAREDMDIVRFGELALWVSLDGVDDIFDELFERVDRLVAKDEFFVAEAVQKLLIQRLRREKDEDGVQNAQIKLAEIFEARADKVESAMLKTHALQEAIDSLQGVKGARDARQRLHDKLKDAQLHMVDEFGKIEHSLDLSDEVARILSAYDGRDLFDCLRMLAFAELPKAPESLVDKAREEAQKFPLSSLFATSIVDAKGRTVARAGGGIENEDTLRYKIIQSELIRIGIGVAGNISPVRAFITEKFTVDYGLILEICRISPFVPSGLEHTFARGIQAFLYGDDFLAAAALIPVLESGLRSLVIAAGRSDTKILAGGIEQTIGLGPLFANHRDVLEQVFTPSMIFCLESLFVHDLGPKIRHLYCHGMTPDGAYSGEDHIYACKLVYSLVLLPLAGPNWEDVKVHLAERR